MKSQVRLPGQNHRLVLEFDRSRARELLLVVVLSVLMLLPLLAYVWQNVEWIQMGYRVERLKNQRDGLIETGHRLRLEKASLESLARIEQVGIHQLGLSSPAPGTVRLIDRDRIDGPRRSDLSKIASAAPGRSHAHVNGTEARDIATE